MTCPTVLDQLKERDEPAIVSQLIKALRVEDVSSLTGQPGLWATWS